MTTELQHPKFTNAELDLIKATFQDNDRLLKIIRKVFFQGPLDEKEEIVLLETFKTADLKEVIRKQFLPSLLDDWAIGHEIDCWFGMGIEQRVTDNAVLVIKARNNTIQYINQQIEVLFGGQEVLKFADLSEVGDKVDYKIFVDFYSRSEIHARVQNSLRDLKALSEGTPTTAELLAQRKKDSSK